ncbi:MAG: hypothetical protein KAR38_08800 [Calditrichia bacterium]|nr:hypothetical protein [Calditrichia bacterium]
MKIVLIAAVIFIYNMIFAQSANLKKILVEYYKNQNIEVVFKTNVLITDDYPLLLEKDTKPTYIHFGVKKNQLDSKADHYFAKLNEALKFKDKINEQNYLDSIRKIAPQCPFLLTMFGKQEKSNYNYENAELVFKKVLDDNINDDIAYINLKGIYGNSDRNEEALSVLKMAIVLNPLYAEYRTRHKYLFKNSGLVLKDRWFKPQWKLISENNWEIASPAWEYFVKAYSIFSKYNTEQLFQLTKIQDREIAVFYLAFEVVFHYNTLNKVESKILNRILKIRQDGYLTSFIATEIIPYCPEKWNPWPLGLIEKNKKYYEKYYIEKE